MNRGSQQLIEVLRDSRVLLAHPGNDYIWSSWMNAGAALEEIDSLIAIIEAGVRIKEPNLAVLFAPAGPIQEVGVSSGWAEEFLDLAGRFDVAMALYRSFFRAAITRR